MPQPVKILLPLWGDRHVRLFLDLILPSWLAPQNLPALAHSHQVEVVFLTPSGDQPFIRKHGGYRRLLDVASISFDDIDDLLVPRNHSTVLTLVWARAVRKLGEAAARTNLLFLLPDLIFADGSLPKLVGRLEAGRRGVFMGGMQVVLEDAIGPLGARVDRETWQLEIAPRALVDIALEYLHPNLAAAFVDQPVCHSRHPYQFFWKADTGTVVARYFNLPLLAARPESVPLDISAPLDMSFPAEFCPSGDVAVVDDSDDGFFVEIVPRAHERVFLAPGGYEEAEIVHSLDRWTTRELRQLSAARIVFHAGALPEGLDAVQARADAFVQGLLAGLSPTPQPHRDHPYWRQQFTAFQLERRTTAAQPEPSDSGRRAPLIVRLRRFAWGIAGRPPLVRRWHPFWRDYTPLVELVRRDWLEGADPLITVTGTAHPMVDWLARQTRVDRLSLLGALALEPEVARGALVLLEPSELMRLEPLLSRLSACLPAGTALCLHVFDRGGITAAEPLPAQLVAHAGALRRHGFEVESCRFCAGALRRASHGLYTAAVRMAMRGGIARLGAGVGLLLASFALSLVDSLWEHESDRPRGYCSSITLLLRREGATNVHPS